MRDRTTLQEAGGKLYVVWESALTSEPVVIHRWFRVHSRKAAWGGTESPLPGDFAAFDRTRHAWVTYRPRVPGGEERMPTGEVFADPVAVEQKEFPVPPPKVKPGVQVRWEDGGWQKLMKRGWVEA